MSVRIQKKDFDVGKELAEFRSSGKQAGAVACFVGLVRDINITQHVQLMVLEHYPGMTERVLADIEQQARKRWDLLDVLIVHRVGELLPSEQIVLVMVSSVHRGEAFSACEFLMDYLKTQAPFWKKEETDAGSHWVYAKDSDEQAAHRW